MMLSYVQLICVAAIPLIFAVTLHEAAHGYIASKLGDHTASIMGRVSLNPARHIDLVGTIILPLAMLVLGGFVFGWAKPVPIAWQNLKNPRRDMALVAAAGPLANLLMAVMWACVAKLNYPLLITQTSGIGFGATHFIDLAARFGIMINCVLLVINLIPLPPLDGSRILSSLLPPTLARKYNRLEIYGLWIFLGLILLLILTGAIYIIQIPMQGLIQWIYQLFQLSF